MSYDSELLTKGIKNIPTILYYKYFNVLEKNDLKSFHILRLQFISRGQNLFKFVKKNSDSYYSYVFRRVPYSASG